MQHDHERTPVPDDKDDGCPDGKGFSIVINGREHTVRDAELTFRQVVALAYDDPPAGEFICFTITYRHAGGRKSQGTLIEGESVKVQDGTVINVTVTDKS